MRAALFLSLFAMLLVAPVRAAEGPAPPSAPTPDEAVAGQPASDPGKPDQGKPDQATADQSKPDAADASVEAVRKAQENGSYKMKDGGLYQPPESRPAPLWNKGYGRT